MATLDKLSAEQRAIIELLLEQELSYDQLADMLALPRARVRVLAQDALVDLSPVTAASVEGAWRAELADYLLNQQKGPEAAATRGHLRRSERARAWSRSVLDSLEQFYDAANIPTVPDGGPDRPSRRRELRRRPARVSGARLGGARDSAARRAGAAAVAAAVRLPRKITAGVAIVIVLMFVLVWPVGLLTGDGSDEGGDNPGSRQRTNASSSATRVTAQLALTPVDSLEGSRKYAGVAAIARRGGKRELIVRARLPRTRRNQAYQVWLYNSDRDVKSLGAQKTDEKGVLQGAGAFPSDYERYKFVDVSREPLDRAADEHSGDSVLRAKVADFKPPEESGAEGGQGP